MEFFLNDLINSNFHKFTNNKTTITFIDGDSFDELQFYRLSFDVVANSLRIILKK